MNKLNPAWDTWIDVLRDVNALRRFAAKHEIPYDTWRLKVSTDIRDRLIKQKYVTLTGDAVRITIEGLNVMGYRESTG